MRTFLIPLILAAACFSQAPSSLLPPDDFVAGWTRTAIFCEKGAVTDPDSLYGVIDGGDGVFTDRGFAAGVMDGYKNGEEEICAWIFDQGNQANALSVYKYSCDSLYGEYRPMANIGDTSHLDTSAGRDKLEFVCGKFFVKIYMGKDPGPQAAGLALANLIVNGIIPVEHFTVKAQPLPSISIFPLPSAAGCRMVWTGLLPARFVISDIRGAVVMETAMSTGQELLWNGKAGNGVPLPAGTYCVRVTGGGRAASARFVLAR